MAAKWRSSTDRRPRGACFYCKRAGFGVHHHCDSGCACYRHKGALSERPHDENLANALSLYAWQVSGCLMALLCLAQGAG